MKIKFFRSEAGPALPIFTIIDLIDDLRDKDWQESAQAGQPLNIAADARKSAYDDLTEKLKEIGDKVEFSK